MASWLGLGLGLGLELFLGLGQFSSGVVVLEPLLVWGVFNIIYNGKEIEQHAKAKYLGYLLDGSLSGESMNLNIIDKINSRLKLLLRQNRFLTPPCT